MWKFNLALPPFELDCANEFNPTLHEIAPYCSKTAKKIKYFLYPTVLQGKKPAFRGSVKLID